MQRKIVSYVSRWKMCGYPDDIPDESPSELEALNLAPSYRAICHAILSNDHSCKSLGFSPQRSAAYMEIKRAELRRSGGF